MSGEQIRFLADENVDIAIVEGLRRHSPLLDIQTANEAGTLGWPDPRVLAYAADHGRVLFTHDILTMPGHFAMFLAEGNVSPGLITAPQLAPIGVTLQDLIYIWEASEPEEWYNTWTRLPL